MYLYPAVYQMSNSHLPCSNPVVQVKAVESGALQTLLTVLATVEPFRVKKKVVTSSSSSQLQVTLSWSLMSSMTVLFLRSCLQWPLSYVTSPTHSTTSCHMGAYRSYQSCSGLMKAECWEHALSPCYMTWSVRRYNKNLWRSSQDLILSVILTLVWSVHLGAHLSGRSGPGPGCFSWGACAAVC